MLAWARCTRAWFAKRGPLPRSVGRWAAAHWLFLGAGWLVPGWFGVQPSFAGQLAFAGVVATMFGSWLLDWETVLTPEEAEGVADQVLRSGASGNLLSGDWAGIAAFLLFVLIFGGALLHGVTLPAYEREQPGLAWLHQRLQRLMVFVVGTTCTVAAPMKLFRLWVNREARELRLNSAPEMKVKAVQRIVRRFGFGFVWFGAILQAPSALSAKWEL